MPDDKVYFNSPSKKTPDVAVPVSPASLLKGSSPPQLKAFRPGVNIIYKSYKNHSVVSSNHKRLCVGTVHVNSPVIAKNENTTVTLPQNSEFIASAAEEAQTPQKFRSIMKRKAVGRQKQ